MRTPAETVVTEAIEDSRYAFPAVDWWRKYGEREGVSLIEFTRLWNAAEIEVTWGGVKR